MPPAVVLLLALAVVPVEAADLGGRPDAARATSGTKPAEVPRPETSAEPTVKHALKGLRVFREHRGRDGLDEPTTEKRRDQR